MPLSDRGRDQAQALGSVLEARYVIDRITASDLRRARETAELLAEPLGVGVTVDPAWRERDFGVLQGLTYETFDEHHSEFSLTKGSDRGVEAQPEGGESLADLRERVLAAWDRLLAALGTDETHLVVTHGGPIYLVLGHVAERPLVESVLEYHQANAAVNELRVTGGEVQVVRENETALWEEAT